MAAYYPLFDEDTKQGPPGLPGIGFKLTNDGNYDMEEKILTNLSHPIQLNDSVTKHYADVIQNDLKSELATLSETCLIQNPDGVFDARNSTLKNLGKPIDDKDAVTKKYVDRRVKINDKRADNILIRDTDGLYVPSLMLNDHYNFDNKRLANVSNPIEDSDAATKQYVDPRVRINDKRADNMLKRDNDGLYVPSLIKNNHYNFDNKRLTNVSDPVANSDAVTKEYADGKIFYASTEQFETYREPGFQPITFNKFSSKLLTPALNLTSDMDMKITIYLGSSHRKIPLIKLSIGGHHILQRPLETNNDSFMVIVFGRKDKQLLLEISPDGKENKIKPHLIVEKISYL